MRIFVLLFTLFGCASKASLSLEANKRISHTETKQTENNQHSRAQEHTSQKESDSSTLSEPIVNQTVAVQPPLACTQEDLKWGVELRDTSHTESLPISTDSLSIVASVSNPCSKPISFQSKTTCLIGSAVLQGVKFGPNTSFLYLASTPSCHSNTTEWQVPAHGSVEEKVLIGRRPEGSYDVHVFFGDTDQHAAQLKTKILEL